MDDAAVRIDDERGAIGVERFFVQHAVLPHHFTLVIGQHRKIGAQLFGPMVESRYEIGADRQNLGVDVFEFANTRLVGGEFARSTTGERGREES